MPRPEQTPIPGTDMIVGQEIHPGVRVNPYRVAKVEQGPKEQKTFVPFLITIGEPSVNGLPGRAYMFTCSPNGQITGLAGPFESKKLSNLITDMYGTCVAPVKPEPSHLQKFEKDVRRVLTPLGLADVANNIILNPKGTAIYQRNGTHTTHK